MKIIKFLYQNITIIPLLILFTYMLMNGTQPVPMSIFTLVLSLIVVNILFLNVYLEYTDIQSFSYRFLKRFVKWDVYTMYTIALIYIGLVNSYLSELS